MKTEKLANGETVRLGDLVSYVNSDAEECFGEIQARKDGSLFFWNSFFPITDYASAKKVNRKKDESLSFRTHSRAGKETLANFGLDRLKIDPALKVY